jgi:hypothetical protein
VDNLTKIPFGKFQGTTADKLKNPDEPFAMEELKDWPLLSYVLLALAEVDELADVLSEPNNSSVWSTDIKSEDQESLSFELLQNFKEQQLSDKKYGSASSVGNYLLSKGNISFPCSLTGNAAYLTL